MAIPAHATPHRPESVQILAGLAAGFGLAATVRLGSFGHLELVLAVAGCTAGGVVVSQTPSSPLRAIGASAIAVAAGIALAQSLLTIEAVALELSVWMLSIVGIVCSMQSRPWPPRYMLPSAAGVALALPLLIERLNAAAPT